MSKKLSEIGEFGLINQLAQIFKNDKAVIKGIGDDTAVVRLSKNEYSLLTTDMLMEGVHFRRSMTARLIGRKALACSLSDIASMGGCPQYALVSLGISPKESLTFVKQLYEGMNRIAKKFKVQVIGGDTIKSQKLIINVSLIGKVNKSRLIMRTGAKAGDQIFVTGELGRSYQQQHHLKFVPRIKEAQYLALKFKPTSMIDISDGLAQDLDHIIKASHVGAKIYEDKIPLRKKANIKHALYDGEDFELLFTLPKRKAKLLTNLNKCTFPFYSIGEITKSKGIQFVDRKANTSKLHQNGYTHF